jgi:N-acetylmuramoyl-L-alanine amidase
MTRSNDRYTTNTQRLSFLKEHDPDLLISIHCNAAGNPMVAGASTYYRHQAFRPITQYIYKEMLNLDLEDFGNVGGFNFTLNSPTEFPSVLVEVAFMSNPSDEEKLLDPAFQDDMIKSIVTGVKKFINDRN